MTVFASPSTPPDMGAVQDVTPQNFMQDVVQASMQMPVMVYFHSPRFPTCVEFGQILQKTVAATAGKVKLARLDIDKNREIAMQFRIEAVPMVYIFHHGQPVDGFSGNLPEAELKKVIEKLVGKLPQDEGMEAALAYAKQSFENGEWDEAAATYRQIAEEEPQNAEAAAGLGQCLIRQQKYAEATQWLDGVPAAIGGHAAIQQAKAALTLAQSAAPGEDASGLHARLAKNADDHAARFALANLLFTSGQQAEAINELLMIFGKDRAWEDEKARTQLVTYFDALGIDHPLTLKGRRRLSSLLFS